MAQNFERLRKEFDAVFARADRATGGVLSIIRHAWEDFQAAEGTRDAAALSYYLLFSLFPLLLVLVVILSLALNLDNEVAFNRTVGFISRAIPVSRDLIRRNLQAVLEQRGTLSLVSVLGAIWSSSSAFRVLSHNIDEAWQKAATRGYIAKRLVGVAMVIAVIGVLLLVSIISTTLTELLPRRVVWFGGEIIVQETQLWTTLSRLTALLSSALMFFAIYRWVPSWQPHWTSATWSAVTMALLWEIAKVAFTRYVSSGRARYEMVYGSLGTVVALLFWAYISALIVLFGAHLTVAIERHRRLPP